MSGRMVKTMLAAAMVLGFAVGGVGVAYGAETSYQGMVTVRASSTSLSVQDINDDGRFVAGDWRTTNDKSGRLTNKSGSGNYAYRDVRAGEGFYNAIRACVSSGGINPMSCQPNYTRVP